MSQSLPLETRKERAEKMEAFLKSIPPSDSFPTIFHDKVMEEISAFQKVITRLKAFISFLAKLNPTQYLAWMKEAFSHYAPSPSSEAVAATGEEPIKEESATLSPKKAAPRKSRKKRAPVAP